MLIGNVDGATTRAVGRGQATDPTGGASEPPVPRPLTLPPGWAISQRVDLYTASGPRRGCPLGLPMHLQGGDPAELARLAWMRWGGR